MTMTKTLLVLTAALALSAGSALAHPKVISAVPAANGVSAGSPKDIRIKFNEAPFAKFATVTVQSAAGQAIKTGKVAVDPKDKTQIVVPVAETLAPGAYKVNWTASGADTHKVNGTFSFTVK